MLAARGRPPVFGTQLTQDPDRSLVPHPLRSPDEVEALRASWGFEPLETYVRQVAAGIRQGGRGACGPDGPASSQRRVPAAPHTHQTAPPLNTAANPGALARWFSRMSGS